MQEKKQELKTKQSLDSALLKKMGLDIDLVAEHESDIKLAKLLSHKRKGIIGFSKDTLSKMSILFYMYMNILH